MAQLRGEHVLDWPQMIIMLLVLLQGKKIKETSKWSLFSKQKNVFNFWSKLFMKFGMN